MTEPLVSIIVPAYNSEKYIGRCIDSILGQEYKNIELIAIDDGSADKTGQILDEYAASDGRVRVFHRENAGVSASRNLGLDMARGKYIEFSDSDDWLTSDATKLLVRAAEDKASDMIIADFYRVMGTRLSVKGDIDDERLMDRVEFASFMVENPADYYYGVLWNKLYRRDIIERHKIRMDVMTNWCEDFLFNLEYIRFAETFYSLKSPVYYYVHRRGSLVSQGSNIGNTIKMKINVFEYYNKFYRDVYADDYDDIKSKVRRFLIDSAGDGFVTPAGSTKLGEERITLPGLNVYGADGIIPSIYRFDKIFSYDISQTASHRHMTKKEVILLLLFRDFCSRDVSSRDVGSFDSINEIASMTDMSSQRASLLISRLKRLEYISSTTDEDGKITVTLLEKGAEATEDAYRAFADSFDVCSKELSEDEKAELKAILHKLDRGAKEYLKLTAGKEFWQGTLSE
ncbi:MAG: glycosyltransferase [Clostridiales bacterium]|nr:glycosyltransferase [Clostridiales bacterium]